MAFEQIDSGIFSNQDIGTSSDFNLNTSEMNKPSEPKPLGLYENVHNFFVDNVLIGDSRLTDQLRVEVPEENVTKSSFRLHNPINSYLANELNGVSNHIDPEFNLVESLRNTEFEENPDYFLEVFNEERLQAALRQARREVRDREIIDNAGWSGFGMSMLAAIVSPENLIPAGSVVNSARLGYNIVGSGLKVGAISAGTAAFAEAALHDSQLTRTLEESAFAVGGSFFLGMFLGSAGSAIGNRLIHGGTVRKVDDVIRQRKDLQEKLEADIARIREEGGDFSEELVREIEFEIASGGSGSRFGVGAEKVDMPTLEDMEIYGFLANKYTKGMKFLHPIARIMHSPSQHARFIGQHLYENPVYLKMNDHRASATAVETIVKQYTDGIIPSVLEKIGSVTRNFGTAGENSIYSRMIKQGGFKMDRVTFRQKVGEALRRDDVGENDFISEAARQVRSEVFEPMREQLVEVGIDVPSKGSTTAETYANRIWNKQLIEAFEGKFKNIVGRWLTENVIQQMEVKAAKFEKSLKNIHDEINSINDAILRRDAELSSRFGIDPADIARMNEFEDLVGSLGRAVDGLERGDDIEELFSRLPGEVMNELRPVLNNLRDIDPALNDALADMARKIIPQGVGVRLANKIRAGQGDRLSVDTKTPAFKKWFGDSKVVDESGEPLQVYHGTQRPDRVGSEFKSDRATSGPSAFFTDNPEIASSYATGKSDTSIIVDDYSKFWSANGKVGWNGIWRSMSAKEKTWLKDNGYRIDFDYDADKFVLRPEGFNEGLVGKGTWDHFYKDPREGKGNGIRALWSLWYEGGHLVDSEGDFSQVLKLIGLKNIKFDDPYAAYPSVYQAYLNIRNPLSTQNIPQKIISKLEEASKRADSQANRERSTGDIWDKNNRDPIEWVEQLKKDYANGENSFVWSSIPDWVTRTLKESGYDGIFDTGGKMGGEGHTVYIPFEPSQIKSSISNKGAFDPSNPDIRYSYEGFTSPALKAVQDFKQNKASPQQWKALLNPSKTPGIKKDELDWLGIDAWLDTQGKSVSKQDVEEFINAHAVELDETVLGGNVDLPDAKIKSLDHAEYADIFDEDLHSNQTAQLHEIGGQKYVATANRSGTYVEILVKSPRSWDFVRGASSFEQAEHIIQGHYIENFTDQTDLTKFSNYKIPGGRDYREFLIRLPDLEYSGKKERIKEISLELSKLKNRSKELSELPYSNEVSNEKFSVDEEIARLSLEYGTLRNTQYTSPHFNDQEIAHVRFDTRNVDGKKTLFVNEIQSDLHQHGRRKGYRTKDAESEIGVLETELSKIRDIISKSRIEIEDIKHSLGQDFLNNAKGVRESGAFGEIYGEFQSVLRSHIHGDGDYKFSKFHQFKDVSDSVIKKFQENGELQKLKDLEKQSSRAYDKSVEINGKLEELDRFSPDAPFKGDLWQQLAIKRMLKYAADNDFDAISFTNSSNIARAVGAKQSDLSVQYDKNIPKFLSKYLKKHGGNVERKKVAEHPIKPTEEDLFDGEFQEFVASKFISKEKAERIRRSDFLEFYNTASKSDQKKIDRLYLEYFKLDGLDTYIELTPGIKKLTENQSLFSVDAGGGARGAFSPQENMIHLARAAAGPELLKHEAIHALKHNGLFNKTEWATLTQSAKEFNWIGKYNIESRYDALYGQSGAVSREDFMLEEAIAEAYSRWTKGQGSVTARVVRIFKKIQKFLSEIGLNMRKEGLRSFNDVFERIESGEIARRAQSAISEEGLTQIRNIIGGAFERYSGQLKGITDNIDDLAKQNGKLDKESVLSMLNAYKEGPPEAPETLTQFIRRMGGVVDFDNELSGISMPFLKRKFAKSEIHPNGGVPLDEMTRMAWDEGFLEGLERPEIKDLVDALFDDINGIRPVVRADQIEQARALEDFRLLESELSRYDIDMKNPRFGDDVSDAEILRAVNRVRSAHDAERIKKLKSKADKLEEDQLDFRSITQSSEYFDEGDLKDYVEEITNAIFDKLTGRTVDGSADHIIPAASGPLKNKPFLIPDELVKDFLENDVEMLLRMYGRKVGAQIELKRKFGSLHLKDQLNSIKDDFTALREEIGKNEDLSQKQKIAQVKKLTSQEAESRRIVEFARDKLLGTHEYDVNINAYTRTVDLALSFNYMRALGGVTVTSAPDIFRTVMVHGLGRVIGKGLIPLIANRRAVKMNAAQAKKFAGIAEIVNQSRLATLSEIADPHRMNSPGERFVQNLTSGFSRATGLPYWNQFLKEFAAHITTDRIIGNIAAKKVSDAEAKYMHFLGIDSVVSAEIRAAIKRGSIKKIGGVWSIEDSATIEPHAKRKLFAAISKDIDSIIVTKGLGDTPIRMNSPTGRLIGQFKSFAISSDLRVLTRGLQEWNKDFLIGLVGMAAVGMFIYHLKQMESGREISDNPGTILAEGIDRSGIFSVFFELNNIVEKNNGVGVYRAAASMFPDHSQKAPASRYAVRSQIGSFMGPSFGAGRDILSLLSIPMAGTNPFIPADRVLTKSDIKAARRLTPFASLPYWRWYMDGYVVPYFQEQVE